MGFPSEMNAVSLCRRKICSELLIIRSCQSQAQSAVAVTEKMCAVNKKIITKRVQTPFYRKLLLLAAHKRLSCVNVNSGCCFCRDLQILPIFSAAVGGKPEGLAFSSCECEFPSSPM